MAMALWCTGSFGPIRIAFSVSKIDKYENGHCLDSYNILWRIIQTNVWFRSSAVAFGRVAGAKVRFGLLTNLIFPTKQNEKKRNKTKWRGKKGKKSFVLAIKIVVSVSIWNDCSGCGRSRNDECGTFGTVVGRQRSSRYYFLFLWFIHSWFSMIEDLML